MKKAWTLLVLLPLGCTADQIPHGVTSGESERQTGTASVQLGQEPVDQPPTEAGTWLIYFAEQGMDLWETTAIFGPPNTSSKGPWFNWRTTPDCDRWELHQWDNYGVWVETGWDDGMIRDMGYGKVIRFHGGTGPGF